jgi:hypothetical protein
MYFGSKKKEPRYALSFSLKRPSKQTPPVSPTGPLWREVPVYKASIKKFIPSLKGPRKGVSLHVPQKWGTYGNVHI